MSKFRLYHFAFIVTIFCFFAGEISSQIETLDLQFPKKQTTRNDSLQPEISVDRNDLVHFGDLIDVDILGSTEYDWRGTLTPEGFLDGIEFTDDNVFGLCRTGESIAAEIAKSYGKFLKNPQIVVSILDRSKRPVSMLLGAIKFPQKFSIKRKVNLAELIVLSGGFTEQASGEIRILRRIDSSCSSKSERAKSIGGEAETHSESFIKIRQDNGTEIINIEISELLSGGNEANPQIVYGDIVTVLDAEPIYVIGGVVNPKKILQRTKLSVSRAIASAGGLTENADGKRVTIFRREGRITRLIKVDLDLIELGKSDDIILRAYDVIDVSEKGRDEKKYPPVLNFEDREIGKQRDLPTRVID